MRQFHSGSIARTFHYVNSPRQLRELEPFLRANPGGYPNQQHLDWIEGVCVPGIKDGNRWAFVLSDGVGTTLGDSIVKLIGIGEVELKHFRLEGPYDRGLGAALLKQTFFDVIPDILEDNGLLPSDGIVNVTLDVPTGGPAQTFFARFGFNPESTFGDESAYTVMTKQLELV